MTVSVYLSSDASAPTLTGQASSLVGVLDACLVNGYGAKSAAGWAKEFTAANLAVYRPPSGTRFRLRVDDSGSQEARLIGYREMSAVSVGTDPFPTPSQFSGGLYSRKSETADTTARSWMLVASERCFYFFPHSNAADFFSDPTYTHISGQFFFGDIDTVKPGDTSHCLIIGGTSASTSSAAALGGLSRSTGFSATSGHYLAQSYVQLGSAVRAQKVPLADPTSLTTCIGASGSTYPFYPDPVTGGILLTRAAITEGTDLGTRIAIRGFLPGLWIPLHHLPGSHGDVVAGSGEFLGKTFQMLNIAAGTTNGRCAMEISDTW